MATKNLTKYLLQPLVLEVGESTLVSPVPSVEKGKQLALLVDKSSDYLDGDESAAEFNIPGVETVEDMARFVFTPQSVDAAVTGGISLPDLTTLTLYAMVFWTMGEAGADAYLAGLDGGAQSPKGHRKR